jgi:hypothetical protein
VCPSGTRRSGLGRPCPRISSCYCVTAFLLPVPRWPSAGFFSLFPLRGGVFCPAGAERLLGLGLEPSPPTRLRVRPDGAARRGAPRRRHETAAPSPHADPRVGDPARSGDMAPVARGADSPPPSRSPRSCMNSFARPGGWFKGLGSRRSGRGWVRGERSAPRVKQPSLRGLRVPSGRLVVGCRWRGFMRTARGPHREASLLGRSRRSLGALRAGASKRQVAAQPEGHINSFTQ